MDALDRKIVRALQGDFPLIEEPYRVIAAEVGLSEQDLLKRIQSMKDQGKIRRMGAVLQHRKAGFSANALCVWEVPAERTDDVAMKMSRHPAVSHCYDREAGPDWPYNIYTMIHGHSRRECEAIAAKLGAENHLSHWQLLFSVKEWKKTSMRYFCEAEDLS